MGRPAVETDVDLRYTSTFPNNKTLFLHTDKPDAIRFTPADGRVLFGPHENKSLGISVLPQTECASFTALVFINDSRNKTLDCLVLLIKCSQNQGLGSSVRSTKPRSEGTRRGAASRPRAMMR